MQKNQELVDSNQTVFAQQEPILEDVARVENTDSKSQEDLAGKSAKSKKRLFVIFIVIFIVVIVALLSLIALAPKKRVMLNKDEEVVEEQEKEVAPLIEEIKLIMSDLELADPNLDPIPFPPVDMSLRLDPKKR